MRLTDHAGHQPEVGELRHDLNHLFARNKRIAVFLAEQRFDLRREKASQSVNRELLLFASEYMSHGGSFRLHGWAKILTATTASSMP